MKFDFNNYPGKYAMHCKTEEEENDFRCAMRKNGMRWHNGLSYVTSFWDLCNGSMYFLFNQGIWKEDEFELDGYTILEWSDFMEKQFTKADLKDGMVGITRGAEKYVWLCGRFRHQDGTCYYNSRDLTGDLKYINEPTSSLDFMQICVSCADVLDEWFDDKFLSPIWTRSEEITEMTIAEIKEKLAIVGTLKIKEG